MYQKIDPQYKSSEDEEFTSGLRWLFSYSFKLSMMEIPSYLMWDSINIVIAWTKDTHQIATFSLMYNLDLILYNLSAGFNIYSRTQLNYSVGQKNA